MSELIRQQEVTTRKAHNCQACGSLLAIGSKVNTTVSTDDGRIGTFYWCAICISFIGTEMDPEDREEGFGYDIWEYDGYKEFAEAWQAKEL